MIDKWHKDRSHSWEDLLVSGHLFLPGQGKVCPPPSVTSSNMATSACSSTRLSVTSSILPSLAFSGSSRFTQPVNSSASSDEDLLRRHDSAIASSGILQCTFHFLACSFSSNNFEEWLTHCEAHFRGQPLPKNVQCPFCEGWSTSPGSSAWEARMVHIAAEHHGQRVGYCSYRDHDLYRYLWSKKVISSAELQELIKDGFLSAESRSYSTTHDPRREIRGGAVRSGSNPRR